MKCACVCETVTALVPEVNSFAPEHLEGHVDVVDFLQAADGRHAQLRRQTPVLGEKLHHPPASKSHVKTANQDSEFGRRLIHASLHTADLQELQVFTVKNGC